ncbi:MAG: hypothetical protein D0530_08385 [Methylococcales bacterium]|nr:MAG: hypothetical protein D0530_08385 [Methylococcales bacterium]
MFLLSFLAFIYLLEILCQQVFGHKTKLILGALKLMVVKHLNILLILKAGLIALRLSNFVFRKKRLSESIYYQ